MSVDVLDRVAVGEESLEPHDGLGCVFTDEAVSRLESQVSLLESANRALMDQVESLRKQVSLVEAYEQQVDLLQQALCEAEAAADAAESRAYPHGTVLAVPITLPQVRSVYRSVSVSGRGPLPDPLLPALVDAAPRIEQAMREAADPIVAAVARKVARQRGQVRRRRTR